jgi:hypothetical protein
MGNNQSSLKIDLESYFEQAVVNYTKSGIPEFGVRSILFYYELLKMQLRFKDASKFLVKVVSDVCLCLSPCCSNKCLTITCVGC